jgi:hypothetical protein
MNPRRWHVHPGSARAESPVTAERRIITIDFRGGLACGNA